MFLCCTSAAPNLEEGQPSPVAHRKRKGLSGKSLIAKEQGNKEFGKGNYQAAYDLYTLALSTADDSDEVHVLYSNRAAASICLEQYQEALADANAVIQIAPHFAKGFLRRAAALEELSQFQAALESYEMAQVLEPQEMFITKEIERLHRVLQDLSAVDIEFADTLESPAIRGDASRLETLREWLLQNNAIFPKVYIQYYGSPQPLSPRLLSKSGPLTPRGVRLGGELRGVARGMHAKTSILRGETIMMIPPSHVLTSQLARQTPLAQTLLRARTPLRSSHSFIAAFLLEQRSNARSPWKPYLQMLEHLDFSSIPLFYDKATLQLLQGSLVLPKIDERLESLRAEYDDIVKLAPDFARFTYDDFVWARLVVVTRIYGLHVKNVHTDGLVPYACT